MKSTLVLLCLLACVFIVGAKLKKQRAKLDIARVKRETDHFSQVGRQPDDADLCQAIEIDENGEEIIPEWMAICDSKPAKNGRTKRYCIFKEWICDGSRDCYDWSDVIGCPIKGKMRKTKPVE